jgi:hypothetical protein
MINHCKLDESKVNPSQLPNLSPSSINLYITDPALWVLKHFYNTRGDFGIHAMRGIAVEDGANHFYSPASPTYIESMKVAVDSFVKLSFFETDEDLLVEAESLIPAWVEVSLDGLKSIDFGHPKMQETIETEIEGLPVGGFIDYSFDNLQVDLKTTMNLPSPVKRGGRRGFLPVSKAANVRQQAIYKKATGKETALLYVTPNEFYLHTVNDYECGEAMIRVKEACREIKNLLTSDIDDVIANTIPDWDSMNSFYWDDRLKELAHEVWGDFTE